jgi:large repetitive protein
MGLGRLSLVVAATSAGLRAPRSCRRQRKITSLAPAVGRARGGNTVTIHGSNFIGVASVTFGHKHATNIHVISAATLTVTAPSGSGTVTVRVTGSGGTSAGIRSSRYTYR